MLGGGILAKDASSGDVSKRSNHIFLVCSVRSRVPSISWTLQWHVEGAWQFFRVGTSGRGDQRGYSVGVARACGVLSGVVMWWCGDSCVRSKWVVVSVGVGDRQGSVFGEPRHGGGEMGAEAFGPRNEEREDG